METAEMDSLVIFGAQSPAAHYLLEYMKQQNLLKKYSDIHLVYTRMEIDDYQIQIEHKSIYHWKKSVEEYAQLYAREIQSPKAQILDLTTICATDATPRIYLDNLKDFSEIVNLLINNPKYKCTSVVPLIYKSKSVLFLNYLEWKRDLIKISNINNTHVSIVCYNTAPIISARWHPKDFGAFIPRILNARDINSRAISIINYELEQRMWDHPTKQAEGLFRSLEKKSIIKIFNVPSYKIYPLDLIGAVAHYVNPNEIDFSIYVSNTYDDLRIDPTKASDDALDGAAGIIKEEIQWAEGDDTNGNTEKCR